MATGIKNTGRATSAGPDEALPADLPVGDQGSQIVPAEGVVAVTRPRGTRIISEGTQIVGRKGVGTGVARLALNKPTTIACSGCHRENIIQPQDHDYRYCNHCGNSLLQGSKISTLTKSENVALAFIKFVGMPQDHPEKMATTLDKLGTLISKAVDHLDGFAKIMGDKALIAMGLFQERELPRTKAERLLRALRKIESGLRELNQSDGTEIRLQAGAHMGAVMAGVLGITGEKWFDVLGSDVNFAARVLSVPRDDWRSSILVSDALTQVQDLNLPIVGTAFEKEFKGFAGRQTVSEVSFQAFQQRRDKVSSKTQAVQTCQRPHSTPFCPYCGNSHSQTASKASDDLPQNRRITVLSIDMAGFSKTAAGMSPHDISKWVDEFYHVVEPIIAHHHGVIIGRNADEVLVRFGAPSSGRTERHALMAALELKTALRAQQANPQSAPIHFRIGLIRSDAFIQGSKTVGDIIEQTQNLQALAPADGVAISADLALTEPGFFTTHNREGFVELTDMNLDAITLADQKSHTLPMIGRQAQLSVVNEAFAQVTQGAQTVLLRGPTGSGKQAVVLEFLATHQGKLTALVGDITPWLHDPLKVALRNQFLQQRALGSDWSKLLSFVALLPPMPQIPEGFENSASFAAALLGRYMGVALHEREPAGLERLRADSQALDRATRAVVAHYLKHLAATKPVALVLHQLDQADGDALKFLDSVVAELTATPLLILGTLAPEATLEALNKTQSRVVDFPHFDHKQTATLVHYLIADHAVDESGDSSPKMQNQIVDHIFDHTGGLPLFIIELMKSYLQNEVVRLNTTTHEWELTAAAQSAGSLEDLLNARLDNLGQKNEAARRLLNSAAVALTGRPTLARVHLEAVESEDSLDENLRTLIEGGYLSARSLAGDEEYTFTPQALASQAYQTMSDADKKSIHEQIYQFIVGNSSANARDLETSHLAALHARGAELYPEAASHYHQAIESAREFNLHSEALSFIAQGREVLDHLDEPAKNRFLFDWLLKSFEIHLLKSQKDSAENDLTELAHLDTQIDDPVAQLKFLSYTVVYNNYFPTVTKDEEWLKNIAAQAASYLPNVDTLTQATWFNRMGFAYAHRGLLDQSFEAFTATLNKLKDVAPGRKKDILLADVFLGLGEYYGKTGQSTLAIENAQKALELFVQIDDKKKLTQTHMVLAAYYSEAKIYDKCIEHARQTVTIAQSIDFVMPQIYGNLNWAEALGAQGLFAEAAMQANTALNLAQTSKQLDGIVASLIYKSAYSVQTEVAEALALAQQALTLEIGGSYRASAHFVLGLAHAYDGKFDLAWGSILESLKLRQKLESPRLDIFDSELNELTRLFFRPAQANSNSPLIVPLETTISLKNSPTFEITPDKPAISTTLNETLTTALTPAAIMTRQPYMVPQITSFNVGMLIR